MDDRSTNLKQFARRVRLVRSWKGMAIGACFGSLAASIWAGLDWAHLAYAEWSGLGAVVGAGAVLGLLVGMFQKVTPQALADSIDRRAALDERLVTSIERADSHTGFDEALHADAQAHLQGLRPSQLYPVRVGKWQASAVVLAALASGIFLLGNTAIFLNDQQKQDRAELKKAGQTVQHVLKPVEEDLKTPSQNPDEKRLAEALRRLSKELEKSRLTKEEAMQKANEIQKQAQELVKDRANSAQASLAKAETAFEQLEKAELEKNGMKDVDPKLAQMSDAERQSQMSDLQKQSDANQQQISKLQSQLAQQAKADQQKGMPNQNQQNQEKGMSEEQKTQLSKELQELMKKQAEIAKQMEQLKLSKNVQEMLKRMMENPLYKKLLEMQKKLQDAMKEAQQTGQQQQLTHEQIEEMQKQLEELAKQLKDDKAMEDYLQKLIDAMKHGCGT
jgi:hypothetical protein